MRRSAERPFALRLVGAATLVGVGLAGCSDLYFDRRETVALGADDAIATNRVVHMVDPWPPQSANRSYAVNGEKMRSAVERYRTGKIIQPRGTGTSSSYARPQGTESGGAADLAGAAASAAGKN